jgi:hypothetical protein
MVSILPASDPFHFTRATPESPWKCTVQVCAASAAAADASGPDSDGPSSSSPLVGAYAFKLKINSKAGAMFGVRPAIGWLTPGETVTINIGCEPQRWRE